MSPNNLLKEEPKRLRSQQNEAIDLRKIYYLIQSNWYYFLIALVVILLLAYLYTTLAIPTYRVSTTILIDEEKKGRLMGDNQLLEGFRLGSGTKNLDNQIMVLTSRTLIGKTLNDLDFDIEYYYREPFNKIALYPDHPITIESVTPDSLPSDIEFTFKYLDENKFRLTAESPVLGNFNIQALFGEIIKTPGGRFRIQLSQKIIPNEYIDGKIQFIIHSRKILEERYHKNLKVDVVSKLGTIVKVSLEGTNTEMDIKFLDKLTEIFLSNSLDKKNEEAVRTIQFIDDQLIGISDSLVITENKLQQFRSKNRVTNLSAQGQVIITQAMSLENEKARIEIEANYYNYLAEYLSKDNVGEVPIAPATIGITDPGLTKLVADLADLQGQLYSKSLGEKNPLQTQLAQKVRNTKEALKETLNGVRRANNMARNENQAQIRTINAQATALPGTERQLLGIERKFKLNDELYTFLLEKRSIAQIQKASNLPDNEVIDPAVSDAHPVSPKKLLIYVLAILAGFGLPLLWIWFFDAFNNTLKDDEDLKKITDIPIAGYIPHCLLKKNTAVFEKPDSYLSDAFRSVRSKMKYFTKENKTPVILITSSMRDEGKTFVAINLASVYSLMGKKTVLIDFDLRRPKINNNFAIGNTQGVSTWLTGEDQLENIIKKTSYENLFIIPAGPVPQNPSELMAIEKTDELIRLLREKYDCIIIDSSPIGTVSDTGHLASLADTCILILRRNITLKYLLENTISDIKISDIKSLCLVINDLGSGDKRYGYGGKQGSN
jgi:capsular exopolysaccharide synthesis family protein